MKEKIKAYLWQEYNQISIFYVLLLAGGILYRLSVSDFNPLLLFGAIVLCPLLIIKKLNIVRPMIIAFLFFAAGYGVMSYRYHTTHPIILNEKVYDLDIKGQIDSVSETPTGQKIIISNPIFLNHPSIQIPDKISLTYPKHAPKLQTGDLISAIVFLRPPAFPSVPNGYNEYQHLYFKGIGAVGTIQKLINQTKGPNGPKKMAHTRQTIANHFKSIFPDEVAQIAIPLTIGDQSVVSDYIYDVFRKSGITHILSVSGFHLSLLVAFVFFIIRSLLALFPTFSEHFSSKKMAGIIALITAVEYIFISGMQIPAIRSLIMISLVLIGLLYNRNAVSTRSWNIAAFIILIIFPELILDIGFQLSFMAVLVLITLYRPLYHLLYLPSHHSFLRQFINLIIGFIIVDVLMTLCLTPFIIYYFNQYTPYSLLGNALTGTLLSFWIMPLLFMGLLVMPLHWDIFFLKPAGIGLEYIIGICDKISHLSYALITVPSFPSTALLWIAGGICIISLMKTPLRWMGLGCLLMGISLIFQVPKPDLLIAQNGQSIALWQEGKLHFLGENASDYLAQKWQEFYGETSVIKQERPKSLLIKGKKIAFHQDSCLNAGICFLPTYNPIPDHALSLFETGTMAVYIQPHQIQVKFTNGRKALWFRDKIQAYQ